MPKPKEKEKYALILVAGGTTLELLNAIDHIRDALYHGDHRRPKKVKMKNIIYKFKKL